MKSVFYITIVSLCFFSCEVNSKLTQLETRSTEHLSLDFSVDTIIFDDSRSKIDVGAIRLPFISLPNQNIKHALEFGVQYERIIANEIEKQCIGYDAVVAKVFVIEAYKEFSATWSTEKERAFVKLKLEFTFDDGRVIWSESTADYFVTSIDAKHKHLERLFVIALKAATHKGLEKVRESYNSNDD